MQLVGYSSAFSVRSGEDIDFMVSSLSPTYRAEIVRLYHGDGNPAGGPGLKSELVPSDITGTYEGAEQVIRGGSSVLVPRGVVDLKSGLTLTAWVRPTLVTKPRQAIIASGTPDSDGFSFGFIDGRLTLDVWTAGSPQSSISVPGGAVLDNWYFASARYDPATGDASLALTPLSTTSSEIGSAIQGSLHPAGSAADRTVPPGTTVLAAREAVDGPYPGDFYNGKIDAPRIFSRVLQASELDDLAAGRDPRQVSGLAAAWDFSIGISTSNVTDISGNGFDGTCLQRPTRAMTGHDWDGTESSWPHKPQHYGAIHFHDDDLDDAGWDVSVSWRIPEGLASGIYALHVENDEADDYIWFVVRPSDDTKRVVFLMPTFSYLAYANEHMLNGQKELWAGLLGGRAPEFPVLPADVYNVENRLNSLYDVHSDGSGVAYSSRQRPIPTMRPVYYDSTLDNGRGSPHQFPADLHLIDWLTVQGYDFDVITDEDLYHEGSSLLAPYDVVLSGTHAEYWSGSMLESLRTYLNAGGRFMNFSGNGYYWVTELDPESGHTIEIRRRPPSTRAWEPAPGEGNISFTGEMAGLWRYRNKAPNALIGVGFTAEGFGQGRPFDRQPDSFDPVAEFAFRGIGPTDLIGDTPSLVCGYGAAGFEFDRLDHTIGSPHRTLLLATASGFSDDYQHASEEVGASTSQEGGTVNKLVRADMTLLEYPLGGAVWSASTIQWCGCLSYNDYDNHVSRLTKNVLDRFLDPLPVFPTAPKAD